MIMMGELKFFLGVQINQSKDGVYVHQSKYTKELLKKFKLEDCKLMNTLMHPTCTLRKEDEGSKVDQSCIKVWLVLCCISLHLDLIFCSAYACVQCNALVAILIIFGWFLICFMHFIWFIWLFGVCYFIIELFLLFNRNK